jgi:ABC-2 type transport system ATP-binding protein
LKAVIEVEHLRKVYGPLIAVDDVSLAVLEGEIFGILGLNGAGKTTAVECIQGLRRPDGGRISVLGLDPRADTAAFRRLVGSQLQESALPDRIKVWEALDLFSSFGNPRSRGSEREWRSSLEQWGPGVRRSRHRSVGRQQRCFGVNIGQPTARGKPGR